MSSGPLQNIKPIPEQNTELTLEQILAAATLLGYANIAEVNALKDSDTNNYNSNNTDPRLNNNVMVIPTPHNTKNSISSKCKKDLSFLPKIGPNDAREYEGISNWKDCMSIALDQGFSYIAYNDSIKKCSIAKKTDQLNSTAFATMKEDSAIETLYTIIPVPKPPEPDIGVKNVKPTSIYFYNTNALTRKEHIDAAKQKGKNEKKGETWELITIRDYEEFNAVCKILNTVESLGWVYKGCYNDRPQRAISGGISLVKSVDECKNRADIKGHEYVGLQYGGECFTGTSSDNPYKYGQVKEPNPNCPELGGTWTNKLYRKETSISIPSFYINGTMVDNGTRQFEWRTNKTDKNTKIDFIKLDTPASTMHSEFINTSLIYLYCNFNGSIRSNRNDDKVMMYQTNGEAKMPAVYKNMTNYNHTGTTETIKNCNRVLIKLRNPNIVEYLNFKELTVIGRLVGSAGKFESISYNKPTTMHTQWGGYNSRYGNDNNNWTMTINNPTQGLKDKWMVELGADYEISRIDFLNREECCKERILSYNLELHRDNEMLYNAPFSSSNINQRFDFKTYKKGASSVSGNDIKYFFASNGTIQMVDDANIQPTSKWVDTLAGYKNVMIASNIKNSIFTQLPLGISSCHVAYGGGVMSDPRVTYKGKCSQTSKKPVMCQYIKICSGPANWFHLCFLAIYGYVNGVATRIWGSKTTAYKQNSNNANIKEAANNETLGEHIHTGGKTTTIQGDSSSSNRGFIFIDLGKEYKIFQIRIYHDNSEKSWFTNTNQTGWNGATVEIRDSDNNSGVHTMNDEDSKMHILKNSEDKPYSWIINRENGGIEGNKEEKDNGWPYSEMIIDITNDVTSGGYKSYRNRRNEYIKDSKNRVANYKILNVPESKKEYVPNLKLVNVDGEESTALGSVKVRGWDYTDRGEGDPFKIHIHLPKLFIVTGIVIHIDQRVDNPGWGNSFRYINIWSAGSGKNSHHPCHGDYSGRTIAGYREQAFDKKLAKEPKFIFFPQNEYIDAISIHYHPSNQGNNKKMAFMVGVLIKDVNNEVPNEMIYDGFTMNMFS